MSRVRADYLGTYPKNVGSEIADALRELAKPRPHGEKITVALDRVAQLCGFDYWRTFDLWYRKTRRVEEAERLAIARRLMKLGNRCAALAEWIAPEINE